MSRSAIVALSAALTAFVLVVAGAAASFALLRDAPAQPTTSTAAPAAHAAPPAAPHPRAERHEEAREHHEEDDDG